MLGPLFPLGRLVAKPGTLALLRSVGEDLLRTLLERHQSGEWGLISPEDRTGSFSVLAGVVRGWIHSLYDTDAAHVEVLTEVDGSATTVLMPSEPL